MSTFLSKTITPFETYNINQVLNYSLSFFMLENINSCVNLPY